MTSAPKRKLIEVALPLEAINVASAHEKAIRQGHPSSLHLWWARRPLAACRAVLFASLVDDPSSHPDLFPSEQDQGNERQRLFEIITRLVLWENTMNEAVLEEARAEIRRSTGGNPPPVLDPFCGGGSIPLEAQRLGLEAHASDLNPVAVLITKAVIEIPQKFANQPPVHPDARRGVGGSGAWKGAAGLAEDVRRYGAWMRDQAERRIGHLYPRVRLPKEQGGGEATAIAWLWARTVTCPNPACGAQMPLVRSFALSKRARREVWLVPHVDREAKTVTFSIGAGMLTEGDRRVVEAGTGFVNEHGKKAQATFGCVVCRLGIAKGDYIDVEANAGRMGAQLLAVVTEGDRGRRYVAASAAQVEPTAAAKLMTQDPLLAAKLPSEPARGTFASNAQGRIYGFRQFQDYFTPRQLVALTTFSDLVGEARAAVLRDGLTAGIPDDRTPLAAGGTGAMAYADAVATYLAFVLDKQADLGNSLCRWEPVAQCPRQLFGRQAIPMVWDYAEGNLLGNSSGSWLVLIDGWASAFRKSFETIATGRPAFVKQLDAAQAANGVTHPMVSTDPPYYTNIGYADLSDFFYVWLRRSLVNVYPDLFSTLLTPKTAELVATPYRFAGSQQAADEHFEAGLTAAFTRIREVADPSVPITIYYAFKQSESDATDGDSAAAVASTGWETMLEGLLRAGLMIDGTWPMRTENSSRMVGQGTNALISSIVLVCRARSLSAPLATYREFAQALSAELPSALAKLQQSNIAPVDLAQAAIGPGMAVFTRYSGVLEQATGGRMKVRRALELINAELDAYFNAEHGDLDRDTRWCHTWFRNHGFTDGPYGTAETLANAKNVSVAGLQDAGVLLSRGGQVRLLRPHELNAGWDPLTDESLTLWECTHHLVRALHDPKGGIEGAARLAARMGEGRATEAKDLAYGLFGISERKGWRDEAGDYNDLVIEWSALAERAREIGATGRQDTLGL